MSTEIQLPGRIEASWQRCADRGLPRDALDVPHTPDIDREAPLVRVALPVLRALQASLSGEPVGVMLSGSDGTVLARFCSEYDILAALDEVALAPGSTYSEDAVGTNGVGLALADDRPSLVEGDQHYSDQLSAFTCAATPIHNPATGAVVGALNLTTWSLRRHDLLMALASQTAMNIEARMVATSGSATVGELDDYLAAIADRRRHPIEGPRLTPLEEIERELLIRTLGRRGGRVDAVARDLGLSRATAYRRLRHYRIDLTAFTAHPG